MSQALAELRAKRARLIERADRERDELEAIFLQWQRAFELVDRGRSVVQTARRFAPAVSWGAGVVTAALAFVRPNSIVGWVSRAAEVWMAWRKHGAPRRTIGAPAPEAPPNRE